MRNTKNISVPVYIILWILIPGFLPAQSIFEQIGRLPVTAYSSEEYGGDPSVWAAIQSNDGLIYFGTSFGLHEYDGVSWRALYDRSTSIGIRSLVKDLNGRIFFGGQDFGYLMTDPKGETKPVSLFHLLPEEVRSGLVIFSINLLGEYLFLQSREQLIRLEFAEDFSLKSFQTWPAETTFSYAFVQGEAFFIHQYERGLFQLVEDEIKLVPGTEILGNDRFRIMLPFSNEGEGTFLMGGVTTGFYLFDGKFVKKFPTEVDRLFREGSGSLYHAMPHQGNYILSFMGGGIVTMSPKGEILKRIGTAQGLPSDVVKGVYLDQSQGLWAVTEDGIARIAIDSPIQTLGKEHGINSEVLSIQEHSGELFLGTSNGLVKFDQKTKNFQSVPDMNTGQIFDLTNDGDGLIVPSVGLKIYRNGKAIRLDFPKDGSTANATFIPKNHPNLLLVGTTTGVLLYKRGLSKDFPWELKGKVPGIGSTSSYFFEGKEGTIFLPGNGKLYTIDIKEGGLESIGAESLRPKVFEFANKDIYSMIDGEFFIRTPEGTQKFSEVEQDFLPAEDFREIETDIWDFNQHKSGTTWYESMAGKKYVLKRNKEGKFVKDERPNSIAPYLSYSDFIDADSILWFGSPKGLIRYDPKKDKQADKEFYTLIRRIETKNDTLPLIGYGRVKTPSAREAKDNSYRFEFAAPYFEEEKKTKYQTFLEGFDPEWVDWNDNRFKEYTNLPAGIYTFRVRALAFTGRISEEAVYSFVVLAPWYATWWAYLLYLLVFAGLVTAIVKWRSRKLKAENLVLEERVKERTTELEKSYQNVELLGEIGRKITATLSAENIIATVYANVNMLMEASVFGIGIHHESTQSLYFPATYENGVPLEPYSNSLKDPNRLAALCFNTGKEIVINDLRTDYGKYLQQMPTPSGGDIPVSLIYLPLKVKGNLVGVITVQSFNKEAFSEYHLYMLRTIAVYTAIAIENAESFQNLQQTLNSLKETQSQLIHAEKMASLGELTAGIAHEIQNPLNFVNNFSEVSEELIEEMNEEIGLGNYDEVKAISEDLKENLSKIKFHGKRADGIVKSMLQHSRKDSGKKELTDINQVADEYLRLSYHGLRAKDKSFFADFNLDADPEVPKVEVIPQEIGRVLLNLINNAFYAASEKKKLLEESGNLSEFKPKVWVRTKKESEGVTISIRDNGNGIPDDIKSKIFQPFFTTKPAGSGTGLGLSMSYDIITKGHDGKLEVESKQGEYTEFTIFLNTKKS